MISSINRKVMIRAAASLRDCLAIFRDGQMHPHGEVFSFPPNHPLTRSTQVCKEGRILTALCNKGILKTNSAPGMDPEHVRRSLFYILKNSSLFEAYVMNDLHLAAIIWPRLNSTGTNPAFTFMAPYRQALVRRTPPPQQEFVLPPAEEAAPKFPSLTGSVFPTALAPEPVAPIPEPSPVIPDSPKMLPVHVASLQEELNDLFVQGMGMSFLGFIENFVKITQASGESLIYTRDAVDDIRKVVAHLEKSVSQVDDKLSRLLKIWEPAEKPQETPAVTTLLEKKDQ